MKLTDIHTHSKFSDDGVSTLEEMVACAKEKGLSYYGVSEHFDFDYRHLHILINGQEFGKIDQEGYFTCARKLQRETESEDFHFLIGGEFAFANLQACYDDYQETIEKYHPDFVVNSVHTVEGIDCWFSGYFEGKTQEEAYRRYLETVRESLDVPYHYDIVAHIGYVSRNAPYGEGNKLRYEDYPELYDDVLRTIIQKGKILEVNSSPRSAGSEFLPDTDILSRYYELGGRKVSFASDAHHVGRIAEKRELIVEELKKIGFTYITVPCRGEEIKVEI